MKSYIKQKTIRTSIIVFWGGQMRQFVPDAYGKVSMK